MTLSAELTPSESTQGVVCHNRRRWVTGTHMQVSAQKSSQSEQVRNAERARAEAVAELREVREELHAAKSKASDESSAARESAVAKDAALREAQSVGSRAQAALDDLTAEAAKLRAQVCLGRLLHAF